MAWLSHTWFICDIQSYVSEINSTVLCWWLVQVLLAMVTGIFVPV